MDPQNIEKDNIQTSLEEEQDFSNNGNEKGLQNNDLNEEELKRLKKLKRKEREEEKRKNFWKKRRTKYRENRKNRKQNDPEFKQLDLKKKQFRELWNQKDFDKDFYLPKIVIDCAYENNQPQKELRSVANQINYSYSALKNATRPLQIHITSFKDQVKELITKSHIQWKIKFYEENFLEVFDSSKVIYLTPDSPNILDKLEEDKIYVIGAISDNQGSLKGMTLRYAINHQLQHASLPIKQHLPDVTKCVLNINHVELLLDVASGKDWKTSLERVIPERYRTKPKNPSDNNTYNTNKEEEDESESEEEEEES